MIHPVFLLVCFIDSLGSIIEIFTFTRCYYATGSIKFFQPPAKIFTVSLKTFPPLESLSQGSNIGIPDVDGKTPLHWAATAGDTSSATATVQLILEAEPSVINWQDFEGRTALHLAVADGNTKTVETLIKFQVNLHSNMICQQYEF